MGKYTQSMIKAVEKSKVGYVCIYVCIYVRMYVCTYVCMYVSQLRPPTVF